MTNLPDDFADAHGRHWHDAESLFSVQSLANADHLYGMSAECGLKVVLVAKGLPIVKPYRDHVDKLWPLFVTFAQGWLGAQHLAMLPAGEPFRDWNVSQRYSHRQHFGMARITPHRNAAKAVRDMLQSAAQGGSP